MITTSELMNRFTAEDGTLDRSRWFSYCRTLSENLATLERIQSEDYINGRTPAETVVSFVEAVGYDAALVVIASLVNRSAWDGRIDSKNAAWAASVSESFDEQTARDLDLYTKMHMTHLDQIADQMRKFTPAEPETTEQAETSEPVEMQGETRNASFVISENPRFGSVEIKFSAKPDETTRNTLKEMKFRWNGKRGLWYGFSTVEAVKNALEGGNAAEPEQAERKPAKTATKPNKPDQEHIRIYWNGIKMDGGKLIKCGYSLNNASQPGGEAVTIYADGYGAQLPRDLLPVVNESDSYTDYFETDRATVSPDHPLYKYFKYAAVKATVRNLSRHADYCKKQMEQGTARNSAYYADELKRTEERLTAYAAEKDPGQPTAADLAEIDRQRTEAENARREAEHRAELEERERILRQRTEGREYIEKVMEQYPIKAGEPVVEIPFSESPAFASWTQSRDKVRTELIHHADGSTETKTIIEEPRRRLLLSVKAAEIVLDHFDKVKALEHCGYDKTDFVITWTEPGETEESRYEGRYDLGDRDGGMIAHIRSLAQWYLSHDAFGHVKPEPETENAQTRLADWLETFCKEDRETA